MSSHGRSVGHLAGVNAVAKPNTILQNLAQDLGIFASEAATSQEATGLVDDSDLELYMNGTSADFLLDDAMCASSNINCNNVTVVPNPEIVSQAEVMLDKLIAESKGGDEDVLKEEGNDWEESFNDLFPDLA